MDILDNLSIRYILAVPDSWGSQLIPVFEQSGVCTVLLCATEIEAYTIGAGLNLSGVLSVVLMENTGIRSIADTLSRFELSHKIHSIFLLSDRGGFGEENWWGAKHRSVTDSILNDLGIETVSVSSMLELHSALSLAIKTFHNEQVSIAIKLNRLFWDDIKAYDN